MSDEYRAALVKALNAIGGLTDDEFAAIGRVAFQSAHLEWEINLLICNLTKLKPNIVGCLLRGQLETKFEIVSELLEIKLSRRPKKLEQAKRLISEMRHNNQDRHTVIHGLWTPGGISLRDLARGERWIRKPRTARRSLKDSPIRELTLEQTNALAEKIRQSRNNLLLFEHETWPHLFRVRLPHTRTRAR